MENQTETPESINQELVKKNITEEALLEMERTYPKLEIKGPDDKAGYELVNKSRILCKNTRVLASKICKDAREEYIRKQKECIAVEKSIVGRIEAVEELLEAKLKVIDDEKERQNQQRELQKQQLLQDRTNQLIKLGASYSGTHYQLQDGDGSWIQVGLVEMKQLDDFTWSGVLARFESRYKVLQEEKAQAEEQARIKAEADRLLAEENARQAAELKRLQEEQEKRHQELLAAEARIKAEQEALAKAQEEAKKKIREDLLKARKSALYQLGFASQGDKLIFQKNVFAEDYISKVSEDDWSGVLTQITQQVEITKTFMEKERQERDAKLQEEAAQKERERIQAEEKTRRDQEEAAEKERQRVASLAPDETKLKVYFKALMDIEFSPSGMSSEAYKHYGFSVVDEIKTLLTRLYNQRPK